MLFQLFKNLPNRVNIICFIGINQDVVSINNKKNLKFFSQNLNNIVLEAC